MVLDLGGSRARPGPAVRRDSVPAAPGPSGSQLLYERVVAYVEGLIAERLVPGDRLPTYELSGALTK
jgi:hypothetical protein